MQNFKKTATSYFLSPYYFISAAAIAFVSWFLQLNLAGLAVLMLFGSAAVIITDDLSALVAAALFGTMCLSDLSPGLFGTAATIIAAVSALVLAAALVRYYIRSYRGTGKRFSAGMLWTGIALGVLAALLGGINYMFFTQRTRLFRMLFKVAGVYFLYICVINDTQKTDKLYFVRALITICILTFVQIVTRLVLRGNILTLLMNKDTATGWGMSNNIALLFAMAIPACAYAALSGTNRFSRALYVLGAIFFAGVVFMLKSRGNMITAAVTLPLSLLYIYKKSNDKNTAFFALGSFVFIALGVICVILNSLHNNTDLITYDFASAYSRLELYEYGFELYRKYPIFGVGLYMDDTLHHTADFAGTVWKWHSTPVQIIACFGTVGALLFLPFYVQRYTLLLKSPKGAYKFFALTAILSFEFYGLMDPMFVNLWLNMFVFVFLALIERDGKNAAPALNKSLLIKPYKKT